MKTNLCLLTALCLAPAWVQAQPLQNAELQLGLTVKLYEDLPTPIAVSSIFNCRYFDGDIYVNQINVNAFGRYKSGSPLPTLTVDNTAVGEHRMVAPFRGANKTKYLIGSGSGATQNDLMSRYDFDGQNKVDFPFPGALTVEGFDWADDDTIICTAYDSGNRNKLILVDVVADPFSLALNTSWANGYVTTSVTTRIRNVRRGDVYSGYAYYGDAGQVDNPNFYAVNLATGQETLLGNAGPLTASGGSFGLWTVVERGGYLFVQTTDDGIQIFQMTSATQLGPWHATYNRSELDMMSGTIAPDKYYGFDVTPDGKRFLLGNGAGITAEIGAPLLNVTTLGSEAVLAWPASVVNVTVESAASLAPASFTDMPVPPAVYQDGKFNKANVTMTPEAAFFRLRRVP
ncbi:MAG TPA: hypothetical protein VN673_02120 [Clostridia bacterium]|nr:hypothetical protein [Clostridia bacterium]